MPTNAMFKNDQTPIKYEKNNMKEMQKQVNNEQHGRGPVQYQTNTAAPGTRHME